MTILRKVDSKEKTGKVMKFLYRKAAANMDKKEVNLREILEDRRLDIGGRQGVKEKGTVAVATEQNSGT